jgi:hypothetical protein
VNLSPMLGNDLSQARIDLIVALDKEEPDDRP